MSLDIATTLPVSPSGPKGGICGTEMFQLLDMPTLGGSFFASLVSLHAI